MDFTDIRDLFAISDVELGVEKRLVRQGDFWRLLWLHVSSLACSQC